MKSKGETGPNMGDGRGKGEKKEYASDRYSKSATVRPAVIILRLAGWKWREIQQWLSQHPREAVKISIKQLWRIKIPREPLKGGASDSWLTVDARAAVRSKPIRVSPLDEHSPWISQMVASGVSIRAIHGSLKERWKADSGSKCPTYLQLQRWIRKKRMTERISSAGQPERPTGKPWAPSFAQSDRSPHMEGKSSIPPEKKRYHIPRPGEPGWLGY